MIKEYTSIHNHSHFSIMDGISLPEEMIKSAKDKGLRSIAITDHGHCHAHADFYLHGKKQGVKTIFGVEAYVIHSLEEWKIMKEMKDEDEDATNTGVFKTMGRKGHLVLLACNREGLSNLYQLVYKSHRDGFYSKPRMDKEMLRAHSSGLVASSACMGGVVSNKLWQMSRDECKWEDVKREALDFDAIFGRGRFFLELQLNESPSQKFINESLIRLSSETGIPLTVTSDTHYIGKDDWQAQEVLYMLRGNKTMATRGADWHFDVRQLYIKSPEEMWESYVKFGSNHIPEKTMIEAFSNTVLIDSLIETFEPDTHQRLPTLKDVENPFKRMGELAIAELKRRNLHEDPKYAEQLLHELKVIREKGLSNYFLIVRKMVEQAQKEMLIGYGRGSAAGSLVCYMLGITDLDPIKHGLMFERFLDVNRSELPDIDMDFEDPGRVKELLAETFGKDNVASLTSYGTFQIKGLMKDIGRVFDLDHGEINKINKKIESELRVLYINQDKSTIVIKLEDIRRVSPTFVQFIADHPEVEIHLEKLYGRNRQVGRHAAGVIIGDNLPAETAVFTTKDKNTDERIVQASFTEGIVNKNISAMGFVKFDLLGLANLRVVHHAFSLIATKTGKTYEEVRESFRPHNIDLDDKKVLKHIFTDGNFAGIFQFTEKGIRRVCQGIKPDCFEDIVAIAALYRPGPLGSGMHKLYAENKRLAQAGELKFEHPILEKIMKPTYGCIIYQEQMLQMGSLMGKLSGKDTQRLRKLFLKKDKSKTDAYLDAESKELEEKFLKGCEENGWKKGHESWAMMEKFGGYGFNKAHSAAYSALTMTNAHLATYYPLEFYSALLTKGQAGELQDYVSDITKSGVKILPVDINESRESHVVQSNAIRLSFSSVSGIGGAAMKKIKEEQPYTSWIDFMERTKLTKTAIIPLIHVGAFDSLNPNMKLIEKLYQITLDDPKIVGVKRWQEYVDTCDAIDIEDYPLHEKVAKENELMGFSPRGSPFEILGRQRKIDELFGEVMMDYQEFIESEEEVAMFPVVVKDFKERADRKKNMMAFVKFGLPSGQEFEAPAFSVIWKHISSKIKRGAVYFATFNRKLDEPDSLVIGKPGWAQSEHSASGAMINVDEIES